MKRVGRLFEKVISESNLYKAITEVNKTHRWNHYPDKPNKTVLWVEKTKIERINELRKIICDGFVPAPCVVKKRYDHNAQKWRMISEPKLYPDQYVHHALIQVIQPVLMRGMDRWCCGSIKGRGAHYGIRAIRKWMKNDRNGTRWCAEVDIRHFYDSTPKSAVMKRMKCLIKDYRVLDLIGRIISDGIKIGVYCSQWFENTLLQPLDCIIRKYVKHYIRYMDNFTLFSNRKKDLKKAILEIQKWLSQIGLKLKDNWQIFRVKNRLPNALGYRFGRNYVLLRKHTLLRFRRCIKRYYVLMDKNRPISLRFAQGLLSRFGMLRHCNSGKIYNGIRKHTQRHLKNIVRAYQRKQQATWSEYLLKHNAKEG